MKRTFIQDPGVARILGRNGVTDKNLREVENAIMKGAGATVSGTAGLKKIRCATAGRGKSGSVRIIFADYPKAGRVYLLAAFAKNERADLSAKERRDLAAIKRVLDSLVQKTGVS
jgi:hypothetical protein